MDIEDFKHSLQNDAPPANLTLALEGLWWDGKGDWTLAHERAQDQDDHAGAWVHAYLHRKEGDLSNADYWYAKAGKTRPIVSLGEEWGQIVRVLLAART